MAAKELIFSIKKCHLNVHIFKVDFAKAFGKEDWDFLFDNLSARGFGSKWIAWIRSILTFSKANILINGSPSEHVRYPFSPLLFLLVADILRPCTLKHSLLGF